MENQTSTDPIIGYVLLDSFNNEDDLVPVLTDQETAKLVARRRYVLIEEAGQRQKKYFAQILKGPLHTPEWGASNDGQNVFPIVKGEEIAFVPSFHSYYLAKVLGEIVENDGVKMLQSAFTRPMPKSKVTYIPKDDLYGYLQLTIDKTPIGILSNYGTDEPIPFYITDKLVNRQLGIFGSTGSGKSNTVIALAETLLARDWCVIIFDHAGEYYKMTEPSHEQHLFIDFWKNMGIKPQGIDKGKFKRFLPVVDERIDSSATKFSIQSKNIPYQLIKSMMFPLSDAQERVLDKIRRDLGKNYNGIPSLKREIENLPDGPDKNNQSDLRYMSKSVLANKLSTLENLGIFDGGKHFDPGNPDDLFGEDKNPNATTLAADMLIKKSRINVIDLGNVGNQDIINIIGLAVLNMLESSKNKINSAYKDVKVAVFLEEAHTFFSAEHAGRPEFANSLTHITKRIFKIGRKFWLNPVVISQQPADIPVGIMSQCVMRITHQLADERDIQIVGKGSAKQFTNMIPDLRKGECLVTTPEILAPQIVRIRPAMAKKVDPQTDGE